MDNLRDFRCAGCDRLLAKVRFGDGRGLVQIKCPRCSAMNEAEADAVTLERPAVDPGWRHTVVPPLRPHAGPRPL